MSSINKVILVGTVGKDPVIRYTTGGDPIASFSLATGEKWTDKGGQKQEKTEWHNVVVFGKLAGIVRDYVVKGKQLYLEGKLKYSDYTNKDGIKVYKTEITLSGFDGKLLLLRDGKSQGGGAEAPATSTDGGDFTASDEDVPF